MPTTLEIGGRRVQVGDEFRSLSPEDQDRTVNEIASSLGITGQQSQGEQSSGVGNFFRGVDDRVRAVARGIPIVGSYLDELNAGTSALFGGDYEQALASERARDRQFDEENPYESTALGLTGGIAGTVAGTLLAAPYAAARIPVSLADKIKLGAGIGAGVGAVEGFGGGEGGFGNRLDTAVTGAGIGAIVGGAAPVAGRGIGAASRKAVQWTRQAKAALDEWRRGLAVPEPQKQAIGLLLKEFEAAGLSPEEAQQRLLKLGPASMPADLAPNLQEAAAGVGRADSNVATSITNALRTRREGGARRVGQALDEAYGPYRDPFDVEEALKADRRATGALYRTAQGQAVGIDDAADYIAEQLRAFPKGPIAASLNQVRDLMTDSAGNLLSEAPQVHAVREQLDDMISAAYRAGESKRGNVLRGLRDRIDEALKTQVPNFAEADARFASAARQQEAFDRGRTEVFRGGPGTMTPARLRSEFARMSDAERRSLAQGQRAELERNLANARADARAPVDRTLRRDFNMEKAGITIGPSKAQNLRSALDREATFIETSNLAESGRGSRTEFVRAAKERLTGNPEVDRDTIAATLSGAALQGGAAGLSAATLGLASRSMRNLINNFLTRKTDPEVYQWFGRYITATGKEQKELLRRLIVEAREQADKTAKRVNATKESVKRGEEAGKKAERATVNALLFNAGQAAGALGYYPTP